MSALLRTIKPYYLMSASDPGRQQGIRRHRGAAWATFSRRRGDRIILFAVRQLTGVKCRFGSGTTDLRWSRDVRYYPKSDQTAAMH